MPSVSLGHMLHTISPTQPSCFVMEKTSMALYEGCPKGTGLRSRSLMQEMIGHSMVGFFRRPVQNIGHDNVRLTTMLDTYPLPH